MSILLDALKKSEQERQLGQTPTLRTGEDEQLMGGTPIKPWIPVLMALLSVTVIGWFGWQQYKAPVAEEVATPAIETRAESVSPEAEGDTDAEQGRTMTELYGLQRKKRPGSGDKPAASDTSERGKLSQSVSDFTAEKEEPGPDGQAENTPPVPADTLAQSSNESPPNAASREKKRKSLEPHVTEPISYWELPQAVREDLPEIKITVLVFAEQPDDRFLLTNGQRMVEKDELGGGLVLDEIRKDGAVFLYRKYRFLVKG